MQPQVGEHPHARGVDQLAAEAGVRAGARFEDDDAAPV